MNTNQILLEAFNFKINAQKKIIENNILISEINLDILYFVSSNQSFHNLKKFLSDWKQIHLEQKFDFDSFLKSQEEHPNSNIIYLLDIFDLDKSYLSQEHKDKLLFQSYVNWNSHLAEKIISIGGDINFTSLKKTPKDNITYDIFSNKKFLSDIGFTNFLISVKSIIKNEKDELRNFNNSNYINFSSLLDGYSREKTISVKKNAKAIIEYIIKHIDGVPLNYFQSNLYIDTWVKALNNEPLNIQKTIKIFKQYEAQDKEKFSQFIQKFIMKTFFEEKSECQTELYLTLIKEFDLKNFKNKRLLSYLNKNIQNENILLFSKILTSQILKSSITTKEKTIWNPENIKNLKI